MVPRPKNLTNEKRNLCVQFILRDLHNGKPRYGRLQEAQVMFSISKATVARLWKTAQAQQQNGQPIAIISKKKGSVWANKLQPDYPQIASLDLNDRRSFRRMGDKLKVSKSTLHRWYQGKKLIAHTSSLRPSLTENNKYTRLLFSLQSLEIDRIMNRLRFQHMHNVVHIDEKWFFITRGSNRYYLSPGEEEPYRACKSKKFIGKIMFLCAVSRPLFRQDGSVIYDGKIGIFPFTEQYTTQRASKNRARGTQVTKALDTVNRQVMKEALINKVLPAIRQKWPEGQSRDIFIQQDNVKPHITDDDPDFREAATLHGFNIKLVQQPPNSPDTNINDLGFFSAIQALQQTKTCKTIENLVQAVEGAFYKLEASTLNKVFLTLQSCLVEIMKCNGHNKYKTPHMGKNRMIRAGTLPLSLEIPQELAIQCVQFLQNHGQINGLHDVILRLDLDEVLHEIEAVD